MDKKRLREYLRTMLQNIVAMVDLEPDRYDQARPFFGTDTRVLIQREGSEPEEMLLDPRTHDGPSFGLVNDGCNAFDEYIKEIGTDIVIKDKVGRRTLEKSAETLLRKFQLAYFVEEDPAERLKVNLRAKQLYGVRSGVIHAGRTDVTEEDVNEMEKFTLLALLSMADHLHGWTDHDQFIRWEQSQMFGVR